MSGGHFTTDELRALARGQDADQIDLLVEHCHTCTECGDKLAVMLLLAPAVPPRWDWCRALLQQAARHKRFKPAAAAVLAAGLVFAVFVSAYQSLTVPTALELRLAELATTETLSAVAVRFHLGTAIPATVDDTQARLQVAGQALVQERYGAAVEVLEELHDRRPAHRLVDAYLGMALYLSGDDSARVGRLLAAGTAARNDSASLFCKWYLANYLLRTHQPDAARLVLAAISDLGARPGRLSRALLLQIDEISKAATDE